jgi:hypothetical protein
MRYFGALVIVVSAICSLPQAWAMSDHPELIAPGFNFGQVDAFCVMPVIDKKQYVGRPLDTSPMRPLLMLALEERGYRIENPGCSDFVHLDAPSSGSPRWLFGVTVDGLWIARDGEVLGCYLTASVFDTQAKREVWRDTANTGYGARFGSALGRSTVGLGQASDSRLFEGALGRVLAKVEKKGKAELPLASTTWAPQSVEADVFNREFGMKAGLRGCHGTLQDRLGVVSFRSEAADTKCEKFQFSVARNTIKSYGRSIVGSAVATAFEINLPGIGTVHFCNANEMQVYYLFAALGSGR